MSEETNKSKHNFDIFLAVTIPSADEFVDMRAKFASFV